jgi:glutamate 5-kinase
MKYLDDSKTIVIKIGSALVAKAHAGQVNHYWMAGLAKDVVALRAEGKKVCLVCSGAVALGRKSMGLHQRGLKQEEKRAASACGQMILMRAWQEVFNEDDITVAQILLTIDDSESRQRYLNARTTLNTLLERGIVPIINENDTVASTELKVGDNDRLGARVAQMIDADMLILLSDIDGLYTADPTKDAQARFISEVNELSAEIYSYAAPAATNVGTGGMITKLEAAAIAMASGCHTVITKGNAHKPISALLKEAAPYTIFKAQKTPMSARKEWIAGALSPHGSLIVDAGAVQALQSGRSLLPVGVTSVLGNFQRGDAVTIFAATATQPIAKGLVAYNSDELHKIMGKHSTNIADILGYDRGDAMIHRDDLVML